MKQPVFASTRQAACLCLCGLVLALLSACGGGASTDTADAITDAGGAASFPPLTMVAAAPGVTYRYAGVSYSGLLSPQCASPCIPYTYSMSVNGWFTVNAALSALGKTDLKANPTLLNFSFTDGINTLTSQNAAVKEFWVWTDKDGNVVDYRIDLQSPAPEASLAIALFNEITVTNTGAAGFNQLSCPPAYSLAQNGLCSSPNDISNVNSVSGVSSSGFGWNSAGVWSKGTTP